MRVKTRVSVGVELEIYATMTRYYPATRHSPEEPASIEEIRLFVDGIELKGEVYDFFATEFDQEIELAVYEQMWQDEAEYQQEYAERLDDLRRMR